MTEERFRRYGKIIKNIDFSALTEAMRETPIPEDVVYEPSVAALEKLPVKRELETVFYGELPVQIGYCNGHNKKLNAVEYHRSSEINLAATDAILLLGREEDVTEEFTYDTSGMEAFFVPAGTAVELYATTLHYAPCHTEENGFQVAIILPKGTNEPLEEKHTGGEDGLLAAKNKWLIGHAEGGLPEGSHIGLVGENLSLQA